MPHCPLCAHPLVWKEAAGGFYLGCPNYPKCASPLFDFRRRKKSAIPLGHPLNANPLRGCDEPIDLSPS